MSPEKRLAPMKKYIKILTLDIPLGFVSRIEKVGGARTPGDNYGLEIFCRHTTILEYKFHIFIVNLALLFNIRIYGPILSYTFFNDDFSKRKIVPLKI